MTTAFADSLWTARTTPKGKPYPASTWDAVKGAPFYWSTPAPNNNGTYPEPWRCAHADTALELFGADPLKFYAVREDDGYGAGSCNRIVIRSRDSRRWHLSDLSAPEGVRVHVFADRLVVVDDIAARPFGNDSVSL